MYQIGQNADKFYAEGIQKEELQEQLEKVRQRLQTDIVVQREEQRQEIEKKKEELMSNILWAGEEVETICGRNK